MAPNLPRVFREDEEADGQHSGKRKVCGTLHIWFMEKLDEKGNFNSLECYDQILRVASDLRWGHQRKLLQRNEIKVDYVYQNEIKVRYVIVSMEMVSKLVFSQIVFNS